MDLPAQKEKEKRHAQKGLETFPLGEEGEELTLENVQSVLDQQTLGESELCLEAFVQTIGKGFWATLGYLHL